MNDYGATALQQYQAQQNAQQNWQGQLPTLGLNQPNPQLAQILTGAKPLNGTKPIVICNGATTEAKDLDEAQRVAEEQAHKHGVNAYILKPVRMVAPKRDVVTTELT